MRIGEVAELSGVSVRSLRYYEQQGLIRSERTTGGWRSFDSATVDRVVTIQHLFAAGLGSASIGELLPCLDAPPHERTGAMYQVLAHEIDRLLQQRRELDREIDVLEALRDDLRHEDCQYLGVDATESGAADRDQPVADRIG